MPDSFIFALWCVFVFIWFPAWGVHFGGILYLMVLERREIARRERRELAALIKIVQILKEIEESPFGR